MSYATKRILIVIAFTIGAYALTFIDPVRGTDNTQIDVWFFDIGQGDGALIQSGSTQIVIDGGPTGNIVEKAGRVMPFWDHTIEYVFVSHPHADHLVGLLPFSEHYDFEHVYIPAQTYGNQHYQVFLDTQEEQIASAGDIFSISPSITIEILLPNHTDLKEYEDPNDGSLVMLITIDGKKFLFTGDAGIEEEQEYASHAGDIDVLKTGHHGSYTSTSRYLLETTMPEHAIISAGVDNGYGHPHKVIVNRLKALNINTWRTDLQHDIRARIENGEYTVDAFDL